MEPPLSTRDIVSTPTPRASSAPQVEAGGGYYWAIIVDVGQYPNPRIRKLQGPGNDGRALAKAIKEMPIPEGMFKDRYIYHLSSESHEYDAQALSPNVLHILDFVASRARAGDLIVFFFAGHGMTWHGQQVLLTQDANLDFVVSTTVRLEEIYSRLSRIEGARTVVLLDACRNEVLVDPSTRAAAATNVMTPDFAQAMANAMGIVTISACSTGQYSYEDTFDSHPHGVFTWFLLRALGGGADYDGDGIVTVDDIYRHLSESIGHWCIEKAKPLRQDPFRVVSASGLIPLGFAPARPRTGEMPQAAIAGGGASAGIPALAHAKPTRETLAARVRGWLDSTRNRFTDVQWTKFQVDLGREGLLVGVSPEQLEGVLAEEQKAFEESERRRAEEERRQNDTNAFAAVRKIHLKGDSPLEARKAARLYLEAFGGGAALHSGEANQILADIEQFLDEDQENYKACFAKSTPEEKIDALQAYIARYFGRGGQFIEKARKTLRQILDQERLRKEKAERIEKADALRQQALDLPSAEWKTKIRLLSMAIEAAPDHPQLAALRRERRYWENHQRILIRRCILLVLLILCMPLAYFNKSALDNYLRRQNAIHEGLVQFALASEARYLHRWYGEVMIPHTSLEEFRKAGGLRVFKGHGDSVTAIALSPSGDILFSAGADRTLRAWPLKNPYPSEKFGKNAKDWDRPGADILCDERTLGPNYSPPASGMRTDMTIQCAAAISDSAALCGLRGGAGFSDGYIKGWRSALARESSSGGAAPGALPEISHPCAVDCLAVSPPALMPRLLLASGAANSSDQSNTSNLQRVHNAIALYDLSFFSRLGILEGHKGTVTCIEFLPDGRRAVFGCQTNLMEGILYLADTAILSEKSLFSVRGARFFDIAVSAAPDRPLLAVCASDGCVYLFNFREEKLLPQPLVCSSSPQARCLEFSPDGRHLLLGNEANRLILYDLDIPEAPVRDYSWTEKPHPINDFLATEKLALFAPYIADWAEMKTLENVRPQQSFVQIVYHPNGQSAFAANNDGTITQWRMPWAAIP